MGNHSKKEIIKITDQSTNEATQIQFEHSLKQTNKHQSNIGPKRSFGNSECYRHIDISNSSVN